MMRFVYALTAVVVVAAAGESAVRSRTIRGSCACGTPSATQVAPPPYYGTPMAVPGGAAPAPYYGTPQPVPGTPIPAAPGGHQHNHGLLAPPRTGADGVTVPTGATVPAGGGFSDDKQEPTKEVKLTGTLVCGKCGLKATPKCSNVLQVKEGDKVVNYSLDDKGNGESYHDGVCGGEKVEGVTVTGTVTEKDGKKYIKPTKVETKK